MPSAFALLLAAAGVGFGHAVLPDHWIPLAVVSRTERLPLRRTVRLSVAAGTAHVLLSVVLGIAVVVVGLRFRETIERHEDLVVGGLLAATGAVLGLLELVGQGHGHGHGGRHGHGPGAGHGRGHGYGHGDGYGHGHEDRQQQNRYLSQDRDQHLSQRGDQRGNGHGERGEGRRLRRVLALVVPFGAAASPDLTVLPVFLAASALGVSMAVGTLLVFALATLGTIVGLTVLASLGGSRLRAPWIDRYANSITAFLLVVLGGLVGVGAI